ncbi:MAG: Grx4 family monothiol glutaredoxin [Maricaulis sp.]|jgi:monothiol glutaredoxin|uniref:Grx4 family monothiol glutaredoxin n=1 Tax=Maricaulis sp. TaxID=1486257 RepID=UPI001B1882EC|nr:Grx4 family monothiol glutaredoxin [Maricaulis sp.]MBO6728685.1 Grx4 family monothiol glutaredoxin [Maricaulis sp.]MBO6847077.1 Grx4 family monothiol glutaredoxin [Maricaulis sp.]MBO6877308.1 Grx4 family monothiol glutaredoxin [Maricaulis sp.]
MTETVQDHIKSTIETNDVVLFMKGTPIFPQCGFSSVVARVLDHLQVDFESVNVLEDDGIREGIKTFSNWPTIPQLYIKGEFVGGCDIVKEMFETGELQTYLREQGLIEAA